VIITRTPLRISLGGGGTDLPSYYRSQGPGYLIAAAITKYIYIAVNQNFDDDLLLKYSRIERVQNQANVEHPLIRECLAVTGEWRGLEISSMADIPAGTGLGSSGAFTVGLLKALRMYSHYTQANLEIAAEAAHIEIDRLGESVGKQDHYIAATGGIAGFTFHSDESVEVEPLALDSLTRGKLEENLLLFFTGIRRSASTILAKEGSVTELSKEGYFTALRETRDMGFHARESLLAGDTDSFGALLTGQWLLKYRRQPSELHDQVNNWIEQGIQAGAAGGKLVGAGGGGFLLFYAERKSELREVMAKLSMEEVRFGIDYEGSRVMVVQ